MLCMDVVGIPLKDTRLNVVLLVVLALLFVQVSDLHLHDHQHAGPHDAAVQISPHLAGGNVHTDAHAQDGETDLFNAGLVKTPDHGQKLIALAIAPLLSVFPWVSATWYPLRPFDRTDSDPPYLRPPLRGPPL